jgi:LuxR family maltose regulon positive regulatory protein
MQNQLFLAAETYQRVLHLVGDMPQPVAAEAHFGLARISYEWNDLAAAQQHGQQSVQLARQIENTDRFISCEVLLARVRLAQKDVSGAASLLAQADQSARQEKFVYRMPEIAAMQVLTYLQQGNLEAAARVAQTHELPLSQARVYLAQGDPSAALGVLEPWRRQVEGRGWEDARLQTMVLQALVLRAKGDKDTAVRLLMETLELAEPGGVIRSFVDEGAPMALLLSEAESAGRGGTADYLGKLLAICAGETETSKDLSPHHLPVQPLLDPLSQREIEVLQLVAEGLSNQEIAGRLFLALSTVKGYNRQIFDKLQVQRRTEAVARARELGLL